MWGAGQPWVSWVHGQAVVTGTLVGVQWVFPPTPQEAWGIHQGKGGACWVSWGVQAAGQDQLHWPWGQWLAVRRLEPCCEWPGPGCPPMCWHGPSLWVFLAYSGFASLGCTALQGQTLPQGMQNPAQSWGPGAQPGEPHQHP